MLRLSCPSNKVQNWSLCLKQTLVVGDIKAGSGTESWIMFFWECFEKNQNKTKCSFVNEAACTRLLARHSMPFVNEFLKGAIKASLPWPRARVRMCVRMITCKSTCLPGWGHRSQSWQEETEGNLLGAAAGAWIFLLLPVIVRTFVFAYVWH